MASPPSRRPSRTRAPCCAATSRSTLPSMERSVARKPSSVTVLITLADVEPAVRLNAQLEAAGITTTVVSPLDDLRAEVHRTRPELIVLTGNIADPAVLALVREQLWEGTAVVGLADVADPQLV